MIQTPGACVVKYQGFIMYGKWPVCVLFVEASGSDLQKQTNLLHILCIFCMLHTYSIVVVLVFLSYFFILGKKKTFLN
jgi:hypothetical protein